MKGFGWKNNEVVLKFFNFFYFVIFLSFWFFKDWSDSKVVELLPINSEFLRGLQLSNPRACSCNATILLSLIYVFREEWNYAFLFFFFFFIKSKYFLLKKISLPWKNRHNFFLLLDAAGMHPLDSFQWRSDHNTICSTAQENDMNMVPLFKHHLSKKLFAVAHLFLLVFFLTIKVRLDNINSTHS